MIYRVTYQSMTARYGPNYIEANSEYEAKKKFAGNAFTAGEFSLITARQVSLNEMRSEMRSNAEDDE